jgi:hypothetical protein
VTSKSKIDAFCLFDLDKKYNHEAEILLIKQKLRVSKVWKLEHPSLSEFYNIRVIDLTI